MPARRREHPTPGRSLEVTSEMGKSPKSTTGRAKYDAPSKVRRPKYGSTPRKGWDKLPQVFEGRLEIERHLWSRCVWPSLPSSTARAREQIEVDEKHRSRFQTHRCALMLGFALAEKPSDSGHLLHNLQYVNKCEMGATRIS
jgi:hypothetical protein